MSSRIPNLKVHLRSKKITDLEQFSKGLIEFAKLDSWGLNRRGLNFFISGLIKTGGGNRYTTLIVNYAGEVASTPKQINFGSDPRIQDQTFIHFTFPTSADQEKHLPDFDLINRFMFYSWILTDWEASFGSIIKDLKIYRGYIETYLRKVHSPVVPPTPPTFQEALFFSAAV